MTRSGLFSKCLFSGLQAVLPGAAAVVLALGAALAPAVLATEVPPPERTLKLAIFTPEDPDELENNLLPTAKALEAALPRYRFVVTTVPGIAAQASFETLQPDLVIAQAGTFFELRVANSLNHIASLKPASAADPSEATGSTFLVRADNVKLQTLADLRGTTAVSA